MSQLVKQRPLAAWFLFLMGAVTGGIASALMEPQPVWAEPADLTGQKFEQLQKLVAAHDQLLDGISRDDSGRIVLRDPLVAIELLVECDPDSLRPALAVCGRSLFSGDAGVGRPLLEVAPDMIRPGETELLVKGRSKITGDAGSDPLMLIMPELHEGPALVVEGSTSLRPAESLPALIAEGPTGDVCIHPDRIELLVECGDPQAEVFGTFGYDELGSYLGVRDIFADSIRAYEFIDRDPVIRPF